MNLEKEAQGFIDHFVQQAAPIQKELSLANWNLATTGEAHYKEQVIKLQVASHQLFEHPPEWELVQRLYIERESFPRLLRRQVEVLYYTFLAHQSTAEENEQLARLQADVRQVYVQHRAVVGGRAVPNNEISEILKHSVDEQERQEAWEGSQQVGQKVADEVRELARVRNTVAQRLGYRDHYAFSLATQELDEDDLYILFERLASLSAEPFRRAKQEIDRRLAERLQRDPDDLYPWHYADPFFQEVPPVFEVDHDSFFAGRDIAEISAVSYERMGLDVRDILARSDLYEREGKDQHAFCTRIGREGDTRILCNLRANARWMSTQMHELGHAIYNKHLPLALPYLLRTPAHISSTEAIAMLMGRQPYSPTWLEEIVGADTDKVATAAGELTRRHAAGMLILVRWVLVMMHFERALYADPDRDDLDGLWWDLKEQYQLLQRPPGRAAPDWAAKFHVAIAPVYYHNYALGELTASQLEQWLTNGSQLGLVGNAAAGSRLIRAYIEPGAQLPWNQLLEHATGELLQPDYFVDQFLAPFAK